MLGLDLFGGITKRKWEGRGEGLEKGIVGKFVLEIGRQNPRPLSLLVYSVEQQSQVYFQT